MENELRPGIGDETFTIEFKKDSFCSSEILNPSTQIQIPEDRIVKFVLLPTNKLKNTNLIKRFRNAINKNR